MIDYYQVLGVSPKATLDEIRKRYHYLAFAYHPDRFSNPDHKTQAEADLRLINEAYITLSDFRRRAAYDERMLAARGLRPARRPQAPLQTPPPVPTSPLTAPPTQPVKPPPAPIPPQKPKPTKRFPREIFIVILAVLITLPLFLLPAWISSKKATPTASPPKSSSPKGQSEASQESPPSQEQPAAPPNTPLPKIVRPTLELPDLSGRWQGEITQRSLPGSLTPSSVSQQIALTLFQKGTSVTGILTLWETNNSTRFANYPVRGKLSGGRLSFETEVITPPTGMDLPPRLSGVLEYRYDGATRQLGGSYQDDAGGYGQLRLYH